MSELARTDHVAAVERLLRDRRAVLLFGARQVGKTTLARLLGRQANSDMPSDYLDLENPARELNRHGSPRTARSIATRRSSMPTSDRWCIGTSSQETYSTTGARAP